MNKGLDGRCKMGANEVFVLRFKNSSVYVLYKKASKEEKL